MKEHQITMRSATSFLLFFGLWFCNLTAFAQKTTLEVMDSKICVDANRPGSVCYKIVSNSDWMVSASGWVNFSKPKGSGNDMLMVNYKANTAKASRKATITVMAGDITRTVTLEQNYLEIAPTSTPPMVGISGKTIPITIDTDGAWTATSDSDWLKLSAKSGSKGGKLNVTVSANSMPMGRCGNITVERCGVKRSLQICQDGTGIPMVMDDGNPCSATVASLRPSDCKTMIMCLSKGILNPTFMYNGFANLKVVKVEGNCYYLQRTDGQNLRDAVITVVHDNGCVTGKNLYVGAECDPCIGLKVTVAASCAGATRTVTATVTGGRALYSYNWGGGISTTFINTINASAVTVTDANGCQVVASDPGGVCCDVPDVTIERVCATNATFPTLTAKPNDDAKYTYSWTPTTFTGTGATIIPTAAGKYTVVVTDKNNPSCKKQAEIDVVACPLPCPLSNGFALNYDCTAGGPPTLSGPTAPIGYIYAYSWSPGDAATKDIVANVAGNYTLNITVKDLAGNTVCTVSSASVTVGTYPFSITATVDACSSTTDTDALITISPTGGTDPYGALTQTVTRPNGPAVIQNVTLTDALGCTASTSVTIPPCDLCNLFPPRDIGAGESKYIFCTGNKTGDVGSCNAFEQQIKNGDTPGPCPCANTFGVNITPGAVGTGQLTAEVTGNPPGTYYYLWTPGGATTSTITGIPGVTYTVSVIVGDRNSQCGVSAIAIAPRLVKDIAPKDRINQLNNTEINNYTERIIVGKTISANADKVINYKIYPNPVSAAQLNVEIESMTQEGVTLEMYDILGKRVLRRVDSAYSGFNQYSLDVSGLQNGIYILQIRQDATLITNKVEVMR